MEERRYGLAFTLVVAVGVLSIGSVVPVTSFHQAFMLIFICVRVVSDVQVALQDNDYRHDSPCRFSPRGNQEPFRHVTGLVCSPVELINSFFA